jgi:mRNA interferase MazF
MWFLCSTGAGRMVFGDCPMSTRIKGHLFEVVTQVDCLDCLVLSDQVKSLDWKVRHAKKKSVVSDDVLGHVRAKMKALLQIF